MNRDIERQAIVNKATQAVIAAWQPEPAQGQDDWGTSARMTTRHYIDTAVKQAYALGRADSPNLTEDNFRAIAMVVLANWRGWDAAIAATPWHRAWHFEMEAKIKDAMRTLFDATDSPCTPPVADQPPPKPSEGDVWLLVLEDMLARRRLGIERYGTPVQAGNGRKALVDAYQEVLDLAVYLRQEIEERKP